MKYLVPQLIFFLCGCISYAQPLIGPAGAQAWMLGACSVALNDVWAVHNNPALTTSAQRMQCGSWVWQRFNASALNTAGVCVSLPAGAFRVGAAVHYFGFEAFNQQRLVLSLARPLSPAFSLGVQLNYLSMHIRDYGSTGSMVPAAGMSMKVSAKLRFGVMIFNPLQSSYGGSGHERIPAYARAGCAYQVSDKVTLHGEADQWLNTGTVWRTGVYYKIHDVLHLAAGAATDPAYYTAGFVLVLKQLRLEMSCSFHETLGMTPHTGIGLPGKE
jgi:hypothetical protein